jgi:UDP-N-acetylglucosamine:LPS N-acetylglucosamine transferase
VTARARATPVLLLVCSSGGHLTQLYNLRPWWERYERTWVTFDKPDATSLLAGERTVWAHHPTTRNLWNLLRNAWLAWRLVRSSRPDLIVSTGAAVAFPFFLVGKLFGARTIYVEVFDRIDSATMTGRLCYPISDRFLLQWDEQKAVYPKGEVVGPLL